MSHAETFVVVAILQAIEDGLRSRERAALLIKCAMMLM